MHVNHSARLCFSAGRHFAIVISIKMQKRQSDASSDHRQLHGASRGAGRMLSAHHQPGDEFGLTNPKHIAIVKSVSIYASNHRSNQSEDLKVLEFLKLLAKSETERN